MTEFGFNNNNSILLHSLIAKVAHLEAIIEEESPGNNAGGSLPLPKNFKELRDIVMHLAKNDVDRLKESENWTNIIIKLSNDINDLKIQVINAGH